MFTLRKVFDFEKMPQHFHDLIFEPNGDEVLADHQMAFPAISKLDLWLETNGATPGELVIFSL